MKMKFTVRIGELWSREPNITAVKKWKKEFPTEVVQYRADSDPPHVWKTL